MMTFIDIFVSVGIAIVCFHAVVLALFWLAAKFFGGIYPITTTQNGCFTGKPQGIVTLTAEEIDAHTQKMNQRQNLKALSREMKPTIYTADEQRYFPKN